MEKTKEEIEANYKRLQVLDRWYGIGVVSGALIILFGIFILDNLNVAFLGLIPTLIALIFIEPKIRCPYCDRHIVMKFGLPSNCPHCKKDLTHKEEV